jgi:hypothetical protein
VKKVVLVLNLVGICSLASAQSRSVADIFAGTMKTETANAQREASSALAQMHAAQSTNHSPLSTSACAFTFISGANTSFLKYCVTANGNISQLETPAGKEHIAVGAFGEGYGFCDLSTTIRYFDYADFGDSGNWAPATVVSHGATSVKIARTTADGIWTLTQTVTEAPGASPAVRIGMTLKNNSNVLRGTFFMRYADVDAGGAFENDFDGTVKSAFAWNPINGNNPYGLLLQNAGTFPADASPAGFTQTVASGPDPCAFAANFAPATQIAIDGSIVYLYALNVFKGSSRTVTVSYRAL